MTSGLDPMADTDELAQALDAVERHEAQFLSWGIIDRTLSSDELDELIASADVSDADQVRRGLLRTNLVTRVKYTSPPEYRSRMAEGVRLFAHLKQLFPSKPWRGAPNLVADFRFMVRPRRFAKRDQTVAQLIERLGGPALDHRAAHAVHRLLGAEGDLKQRTLSRFQVDATNVILQGLKSPTDQACIVSAGTGQGKTLAFYLPTLLHLVQRSGAEAGTSVLAVYPRNELLKDQLLATLREVRRLQVPGQRSKIRIGTYFGPTPNFAGSKLDAHYGWKWSSPLKGYACPFLVCPGPVNGDSCGGRLVWRDEDRKAHQAIERLICESCGEVIGDDVFTITRNRLGSSPSDILFTSTETLNRRLSDNWNRHIFGVGPKAAFPPRLILLDEAHTYVGTMGAQAAYVLRRWRSQVKGPVMWVGLSATLREAQRYFSSLTGVDLDRVTEVAPHPGDSIEKGHEYQLLVRGDPASQTALLSTSIQSLMLVMRLLDPLDGNGSGLLGSKVFAFCDNLDLVNRLYRQLLDAEGRTPFGKPNPNRQGSLALLRSEAHNLAAEDWPSRDGDGQAWWLIDQIRPSATQPQVGRTSSQDSGVTQGAELVVATASLEVGYDDPDVGAVLQHKAPRDVAQFVQRRGRAGRSQQMRPWTVVVLSDYGRDRLAYQSYEQLFDPLLPPKTLPLSNRSVQRMQATFAVMDWIAVQAERQGKKLGFVRDELAAPVSAQGVSDGQRVAVAERQAWEANLLSSLLEEGGPRFDLEEFLMDSLGLSIDTIRLLLWQGPRSVLLEAVPTVIRRLESDWHAVVNGQGVPHGDRFKRNDPLPEFLPSNLFSDLSLPEISVEAPEDYDAAADTAEPAFLALNQFAPGNVTFRYAVKKTRGLWIDPRAPDSPGFLEIGGALLSGGETLCELEGSDGRLVPVIRPYQVNPTVPEVAISSTSSGRLDWKVKIEPDLGAIEAPLPEGSPWLSLIESASFFVQAAEGGVRVLRYALGGRSEIGVQGNRQLLGYEFRNAGEPVAGGIELDVDGVEVRILPPANIDGFRLDSDEHRLRQLTQDWFHQQVANGFQGNETVNHFLSLRIAELGLAAVARAVAGGEFTSIEDLSWSDAEWKERVLGAFDLSLQGLRPSDEDESESPLRSRIDSIFEPEGAADILRHALSSAGAGVTAEWYPYIRQRFAVSVGAAIGSALQSMLPEFDVDEELHVDLIENENGSVSIWLTESTVGGGGITESFYAVYAEDPRRFWHVVTSALEAPDAEQVVEGMTTVAMDLEQGNLSDLARAYRGATDGASSLRLWMDLMGQIAHRGIAPSHSLSVALATRMFRAGTSAQSDAAIAAALRRWKEVELDLDIAVDHRTACGILADDEEIARLMRTAVPEASADQDKSWVFNVLLGILWASPESLRPSALQVPNPYVDDAPASERTLVLDWLEDDMTKIDATTAQWRGLVDSVLSSIGRCVLVVPVGEESSVRVALLDIVTEPVEVGALLLFPKVTGSRRRGGTIEVTVELNEAPQ